ncbi:MAG: ABC transporter permease subunit [Chloroflexi bacterium]|nr:ABC transporter permease subunit [Chloroflexota bacterium]
MTTRPTDETSSIYDLGYRSYEGVRLGRRYAVLALYRESLRAAFGLGRSTAAKIAPAILIGIALFPALIQLILGAILPIGEIELVRHDDYYSGIKFVMALYVGVVAPDIVGRDQRTRSLTLYFTRAITRYDYALGKLAAMTTAMLAITLVPQLLLFVGNALATDQFGDFIRENWDELPPIFGSALLGSWLIAAIGTLIAAQTPQRAFATVGIIVAFILPIPIAAILVEQIDAGWADYAVYLSPLDLVDGLTYWLFGTAPPASDSLIALTDFSTATFAGVAVVVALAASALLVRRYIRVQA